MVNDRPDAADVVDTADSVVRQLRSRVGQDWTHRAGTLDWTVRDVVDHLVDVGGFYALHLAARSDHRLPVDIRPQQTASNDQRLDLVAASYRLLAAAITTTGAGVTAWHFNGPTAPTGFAGLACNELLVHGWDAAQGLQMPWLVDDTVCRLVLIQTFPAVTLDDAPWPTLLAANGRSIHGEPDARDGHSHQTG